MTDIRRAGSFAGTIAIFLLAIIIFYRWIGGGHRGPGPETVAERESPAERDAQRLADMRDLTTALSAYYQSHETYPKTPASRDCVAPYNNMSGLSVALVPDFLKRIPQDPELQACAYNYWYWSDGQHYVIMARLENLDPAKYADRWCIGAVGGTIPYAYRYWKPCPAAEHP